MILWFLPRNSPLKPKVIIDSLVFYFSLRAVVACGLRRSLPGDSEEDGVGNLAGGAGDEDALGLVVEAGLVDGHGSGGLGGQAADGQFVQVGDHIGAWKA
jgi:hypothetical protein